MRRFLASTLIGFLWTAIFGLSLFAQTGPDRLPSPPSFTVPPFEPPAGATITVTTGLDNLTGNGDCTLREAIQAANTDAAVDACPAGSGEDLILLPAGSYGLSLEGRSEDENATGDLDIRSSLVISGGGSAMTIIDANGVDRVLHILTGTVEIRGLTVQGGRAAYGADSECGENGENSCPGESGGGIFNQAQSTIIESSVRNNAAYSGGGIANGGTLQLVGSQIGSNQTFDGYGSYGHAIFDGGPGAGIANTGILTMETSTVSRNRTGNGVVVYGGPNGSWIGTNGGDGGGIFNTGTAVLRDTGVISNTTGSGADNNFTNGGNGGGIVNAKGDFFIEATLVAGNSTGPGGYMNPYQHGSAGYGGGIYSTGAFSIANSEIVTNVTHWFGEGGGVYSAGILSITSSKISANSASWDGGGIYSTDVLSITESTISANSAGFDGDGGGIYTSGDGTIVRSAIRRNASGNNGSGGGLANAGALVLVNSLIDNNITRDAVAGSKSGSINAGPGGGIANSGLVILKNSTISANRTGNGTYRVYPDGSTRWGGGGMGGGIHNLGTVWLESTTVVDNLTGAHAPCNEMSCEGPNAAGGGIANEEGAVILRNTILSNSSAAGEGPDCWGIISSAGYNLIQSTSGCTLSGYVTGNIVDRYAWLEPLADNGGPTATYALRPQSPALNAGSCSDSDGAPVVIDQRGEFRPQGVGCDIGAFESGMSFTPPETLHLPLIRKQSN